MNRLKTNACLALATGLLAVSSSQAQDAPRDCGSVTSLQKRIVERADVGVEALRSFVWTARVVHGIDMRDVKAGLDAWRATVTCQQEVAAAAAAVAKAPAADAPAEHVAAAGH